MSGVTQADDCMDCPLCMEPLEMDDLNFYPCTCGYQICRFCWHRIRTDENGLCPACRKTYPENPANFKPLTQEELQRIRQEKKQKDQQRKQKVSENRKHLANVRVVQKNLVFVVGLTPRLADTEILKKYEYFGRFGKINKVVINNSTSYAGAQGPSASAYVTYQRSEDALRCIQVVNNASVDGRTLKASLGTTKYCSNFMKNQQCPKSDCMYLHELGDDSASFTKEEMQQGKHQEFEKKLQDQFLSLQLGENPLSISFGSGSQKKTCGGSGKESNLSKSECVSSAFRDAWPTLNVVPSKETKKSRGKCGATSKYSCEDTSKNNAKCTVDKNSEITGASPKDIGSSLLLPTGLSSSDSCASSPSPPAVDDGSPSSDTSSPPPPLSPVSSPVPFNGRTSSFALPTPPSSSSSYSEVSSSFPSDQQQQVPPVSLFSSSAYSHQPEISRTLPHDEFSLPQDNYISCEQFNFPHDSSSLHQDSSAMSSLRASPAQRFINENSVFLEAENSLTCNISKCQEIFPSEPPKAVWSSIFDPDNSEFVDDDLGFDPFEETNKALAEDIKLELKQRQMQDQQHFSNFQQFSHHHHQQQQQQQLLQQHSQQLSESQLKTQLFKNSLQESSYSPVLQKRLPPGFSDIYTVPPCNGHGDFHYMGHHSGSQNCGISSARHNQSSRLPVNGMTSPNNLAIPPGLASSNLLSASNNALINSSLSNHFSSTLSHVGVEQNVPPGLGLSKADPFLMKNLESSLRNSVNKMNNANALNSLAVNQPSANNALINFINMTHRPQQNQQLQSQQNLFHLTVNPLSNASNGWMNGGVPDLTALDPAIVSSGQLTESRSDSPPSWLLDGVQNGSLAQWNNVLPYSFQQSAGLPSGLRSPIASSCQISTSAAMWSPTSPPPGFSNLHHHPKHSEPHKIDHL